MASWTDFQVLDRIQRLAWEAHGLYADRCWSLLRRRLALPDEGRDRDEAPVPAETVESYGG